jgi:hypothetical protein
MYQYPSQKVVHSKEKIIIEFKAKLRRQNLYKSNVAIILRLYTLKPLVSPAFAVARIQIRKVWITALYVSIHKEGLCLSSGSINRVMMI